MSIPFSNTNYRIPRGFANLLEGFTREVLREQPKDIPLFGAKYFQGLLKQRAETNFDPAEWGASLEDRFYNNHAFQKAELNAYTLEGLENGTQNGISLPENSHITEPTNHSADKAQKEVERSGELGQINAATVIQAAFRGHITRQEVHRLKRSTDENSLKSTSCDSKPEAVLQKTDIYQEKHMESDAAALPNHGGEQTTTDIESGGSTGGGLERVLDTEIKGETTDTATENDEELHGVHTSAGEGDSEPKDLHTLETGDPALEEEGKTLNSETSNFQAEELPVSSEAHSHSFIQEQNHVAETITEQSQVITADDAAEHIPDDSTMETNTSPVTNASESPNDETDSDKAEISAEKRDFQPPELRLSLKENPHFCRLSPHLSGMDCCHNENFRKPLEEALDIALDDPDANAAAAKIQAGFRGHMTRKKMKSGEKDLKKDGKERSSSQGEGD